MTQQEIQFIEENKINFESVKLGFTRNIPFPVLEKYEEIYRKYLDQQFSLTYWCGECVFDMLKRLIRYYENAQPIVQVEQENAQSESQTITLQTEQESQPEPIQGIIEQPKKKRGRPKK